MARFELDVPQSLVVQADAVYRVYQGLAQQGGDPYADGSHRLAFRGQAGENLLVFRVFRGRRSAKARIWTLDHEVSFNTRDVTFPDLVVDDMLEQYVGLPVLNHTDGPVTGLRARVVENEYLEAVSYTHLRAHET